MQINGLRYKECELDLVVEGCGGKVVDFHRNGMLTPPFLPADLRGEQAIRIRLSE